MKLIGIDIVFTTVSTQKQIVTINTEHFFYIYETYVYLKLTVNIK